jgi:hypothetical protein
VACVTTNGPPMDARAVTWCCQQLLAESEKEIFRTGHLSTVIGIRLTDGQEVVVKVRPYQRRLVDCHAVHQHVFRSGFPCPEPLVAPTPLGPWCVSAERMVTGGSPTPSNARDPSPYAMPFAKIVSLATPLVSHVDLEPKPSWNRWDHHEHGPWPIAEDAERPLNDVPGPKWLEEAGRVARRYLGTQAGPLVLGHGDWYWDNLRWTHNDLLVTYDWDSVIVERESILVGYAASDYILPTLEESEAFIGSYQEISGRAFTTEETSQCWAAVLWLKAFNAKKQLARSEPIDTLSSALADRIMQLVIG